MIIYAKKAHLDRHPYSTHISYHAETPNVNPRVQLLHYVVVTVNNAFPRIFSLPVQGLSHDVVRSYSLFANAYNDNVHILQE